MKNVKFSDNGMPLNSMRREAFNKFNHYVYNGEIELDQVQECFCKKTDFDILSKYDRFGLPFGTQICRSCGLITQTLRINEGSMEKFYEEVYWPLIDGRSGYITEPKENEGNPFIIKHVPTEWKEITIFELGCGSGTRISSVMDVLSKLDYQVKGIGCDYSTAALKEAQIKGIKTIQGGFKELATCGKADILILSHVVEHLPCLNTALNYIDEITHSESLIYIEVPGVLDLKNKKEYFFNYQIYNVLAHTFNFSLNTLSAVMNKKNFVLIEGDEYVRSVFKKGKPPKSSISYYKDILEGLDSAYKVQLEFEKIRYNPVIAYLRRLAKALLGRET